MEQKIIADIVTAVTPHMWWMFTQMLITVAIGFALMGAIKNLVAYAFVRFDREISKNVRIIYEGKGAIISEITIKHLVVRLEDGNDVLIPIQKVNAMIWTIARHNNPDSHTGSI